MNSTFSGSRSMRENYNTQGVDAYYASTGQDYRNPHYPAMVTATSSVLNLWLPMLCQEYELEALPGGEIPGDLDLSSQETLKSHVGCIKMLDLACGAGEATQAVYTWSEVLRQSYVHAGDSSGGKRSHKAPEGPGSEITSQLVHRAILMHACDPYTQHAYHHWTGREAEGFSFQDVADGCLYDRAYHACVCSYALHVLEGSKLFATLLSLSLVCGYLIVLSPHKKPVISAACGWNEVEHIVVERVHARIFESLNLQKGEELREALYQTEPAEGEDWTLPRFGPPPVENCDGTGDGTGDGIGDGAGDETEPQQEGEAKDMGTGPEAGDEAANGTGMEDREYQDHRATPQIE